MTNFFRNFFRITKKVVKDEINEIKELQITDEDREQARKLSTLAVSAMVAAGLPAGVLTSKILERVLAYGIRDLKDGLAQPNKLIVERVITEIRAENQGT